MRSNKKFSLLIILLALIINCCCYLQLQLFRNQLREKLKNQQTKCITIQVDKEIEKKKKEKKESKKQNKKKAKNDDEDDDGDYEGEDDDDDDDEEEVDDNQIPDSQNYREICYEKDISYSLPMYINSKINMISLDTTTPISWFKGSKCHLQQTTKKCSVIVENLKDKLQKLVLKKNKQKAYHSSQQFAIIEGSSQLVKGIQQTGQNFQFITRDSSRLTNFIELLALGFYMKGEKDRVALQSTKFINATQISRNLNYLCDGAISLRFDDMSEKSFIKQLIDYQRTNDKYITIFINSPYSFISLGQIAGKYSKNGIGGLQWMDLKDDENYGKLPVISDIIIEGHEKNEKGSQNGKKFSQIKDKQYPAVLSLSASYIGIPKLVMEEWLKKFNKKSDCSVNEKTKYLECKKLNEQQQKLITFEFSGKKISFKLSELVLGKEGKKTLINMKETLHDKYAILGEPLFKKYLVVFDYTNNKIGFGQKSENLEQKFSVVSVIRFVCFVFVFGFCFILCFLPIKRCIQMIKNKTKYGVLTNLNATKSQTRRLKQYAPIEQNPYDKVNEVLDEENN